MGRGKVIIERIVDQKTRRTTFLKRKNGIMKKAMEISIMCDCELALVVLSPTGRMYSYYSGKPGQEQEIQDNKESMQSFFDNLPKRWDYSLCKKLTNLDYASYKKPSTEEIKAELDLEESMLSLPCSTSDPQLSSMTIEEMETDRVSPQIINSIMGDEDPEINTQDYSLQPSLYIKEEELKDEITKKDIGKGTIIIKPIKSIPHPTNIGRKNRCYTKKNREIVLSLSKSQNNDDINYNNTNNNNGNNKKLRISSPTISESFNINLNIPTTCSDLSTLFSPHKQLSHSSPTLMSSVLSNQTINLHGNSRNNFLHGSSSMAASPLTNTSSSSAHTSPSSLVSFSESADSPITQIQGSENGSPATAFIQFSSLHQHPQTKSFMGSYQSPSSPTSSTTMLPFSPSSIDKDSSSPLISDESSATRTTCTSPKIKFLSPTASTFLSPISHTTVRPSNPPTLFLSPSPISAPFTNSVTLSSSQEQFVSPPFPPQHYPTQTSLFSPSLIPLIRSYHHRYSHHYTTLPRAAMEVIRPSSTSAIPGNLPIHFHYTTHFVPSSKINASAPETATKVTPVRGSQTSHIFPTANITSSNIQNLQVADSTTLQ